MKQFALAKREKNCDAIKFFIKCTNTYGSHFESNRFVENEACDSEQAENKSENRTLKTLRGCGFFFPMRHGC